MKIIIVSIILTFFATIGFSSQSRLNVFFPGEIIEYEVSFMGIRLGRIIIKSIEETDLKGNRVNFANVEMKSNLGIPFVSLHAIFESWMEKNLTHSHRFVGSTKQSDDTWRIEKFDIQYERNLIQYELWNNQKLEEKRNIEYDKKINDGCSLFFFARQYTDLGRTVRVPTLINSAISFTSLNFHGKPSQTRIKAVDYPVKTLFFDGRADWEGVYGLKGYFKGWFSDDDARVPIKAEMNVYVGSVDIELVKWTRGNWQPPRSN